MLKHQLTSASPAEAQLYSPQKLATRANQSSERGQIMLEDHQTNLEQQSSSTRISPPSSLLSRPSNSIHHGNLTLNQSIYANTVTLPKMPMNGNALPMRHGSNGSNGSSSASSNKNNLNTSKLSSGSPATTNQTKTSYMDSSRDHSHHELENTTLSPIRSKSIFTSPTPLSNQDRNGILNTSAGFTGNGYVPRYNADTNSRDQSLLKPSHNSTAVNKSGINNTHNGTFKKLNTSLIPANVSKFMLLSKEAGVKSAILSLILLCLVSLLMAILSLFFLLKISPASTQEATKNYQFDFLSMSAFESLHEVTLAFSVCSLILNLVCCAICVLQVIFAVKLVKSAHGRQRTTKYLKGASTTRNCAIGGFFVSIPLFLAGVILYTFLHFDYTPAITASVVIGCGIVFCAAAAVHNVYLWQKEKTANVTKSVSNSPVLGRTFQNLDASTTKTATMVGLPQATLDLSGPNSRVLELSTLV